MARTHLQEMLSVADVLQTWNWDLTIPSIPGLADPREITYKCTSTSIPSSKVEQVALEAHGVKLNYAGRRTWDGSWTATFFETRLGTTRDAFINWMELMRSWQKNSGTYKSIYGVTAEIELYDDLPKIVRRIRLYGLFPTDVGEATLDQTSGIIQYNTTFSYDWTEDLAV